MANRLVKIAFGVSVIIRLSSWLKYRYYSLSKTLWAKMHSHLRVTHSLLLRIHKRTRIKLVENITFRLGIKVFVLCNFCFEKHCFFFTLTDHVTEREALRLKCN